MNMKTKLVISMMAMLLPNLGFAAVNAGDTSWIITATALYCL